MKYDVFKWTEVGKETDFAKGRVHVMCDKSASFWVQAEGYEVLAAVGHELDIETAYPVTVRIAAATGFKAFAYGRMSKAVEAHQGERFTNIDRMPHESGSVLEVRRAIREFQLGQQSTLRALREERQALKRDREAAQHSPAPEPAAEPVEEPVEEPAEE